MSMFGTTGIRKTFSTYDKAENSFTPSMALRLGLAIGTFVNSGTVVIGRDIRTAAVPIELAITSGLVSTGCRVLAIGMVTTPTLAMSIDHLNADCGIMITASHNPPEYIGVKLWNKNGLGFDSEQENVIEEIYEKRGFLHKEWNEVGSVVQIQDFNSVHVEQVLKIVKLEEIKRRFDIIIDPGNGSSCEIAPLLLKKLGFKFISLNSQPDGYFPGRLSEPSSKNLQDLKNFVSYSKTVELGIALDGDADRVVFVQGYGELVEPIRALTFLAREYIREKYPDPATRKGLRVVTPLNSSGVIEHVLRPMGVEVIRTQVGDIKVSLEIKKSGAILGGENAGTYIWPEFHLGPDSIITIAMMLKYLSKYDMQFKDVIKDIPEFPYIQAQYALETDQRFSLEEYQKLGAALKNRLSKEGYGEIEDNYVDGCFVMCSDGWILIRKSGTTPMIRINAESKSGIVATEKLREIAEQVMLQSVKIAKK